VYELQFIVHCVCVRFISKINDDDDDDNNNNGLFVLAAKKLH